MPDKIKCLRIITEDEEERLLPVNRIERVLFYDKDRRINIYLNNRDFEIEEKRPEDYERIKLHIKSVYDIIDTEAPYIAVDMGKDVTGDYLPDIPSGIDWGAWQKTRLDKDAPLSEKAIMDGINPKTRYFGEDEFQPHQMEKTAPGTSPKKIPKEEVEPKPVGVIRKARKSSK